jgi:hypothetical protein
MNGARNSDKRRLMVAKTIPTDKARQGRRGLQLLIILICALVLAMLAWAGAEIYGRIIEPPAASQSQG